MEKLQPITEWSLSVSLRILEKTLFSPPYKTKTLQQRWTRIVTEGDGTKIEEKWVDVPVVTE